MTSTTTSSNQNKICRKCNGTCPPCRPWRCKFGKARTLEECENDMQRSPLNLKRCNSAPTVYARAPKTKSQNCIEKALAALNIRNNPNVPPGALAPGTSASNDETSSSATSTNASSIRKNSRRTCEDTQRQMLPLTAQLKEPETSHIFLAIAADPVLVQYSKMVLNEVIKMPQVPEITSLGDSRCIWPHTVHLTIHSFGKVLNVDIPRVVEYCKKNIEVIESFFLNITGMFHHQKLHTIGFQVEKRTVEPLRQIKSNMSKWFNKPIIWDGYTPVLSLLRTQSPRGAKFSCAPLSKQSIDIILQKFGVVQYVQNIIPARDIQLCLARSSTETTFYRNLLL